MSSSLNFPWLWLCLLFGPLNIPYVRADWPSSNSSNIQLLGLFEDVSNRSVSAAQSLQMRAMFKAVIVISGQYNITIAGQSIGWQSVQTEGVAMNALGNSCRLISTANIAGIVGPALSREAIALAPLAARVGIPLVSYSATDPTLSDRDDYPGFYRTVPSDDTAALAIAQLFELYNWTSCTIIYQNDAFGIGGAQAISDAFDRKNLIVTQTIIFNIHTLTTRGDLKSLLTGSTARIVILWVDTAYAISVLKSALNADVLGPQFTWILSSNIPLDSFDKIFHQKLSGMLAIEPVVGSIVHAPINSTLLNAAYQIWQQYEPESFPGADKIDYYALFAFDATWLLIQALQQFCSSTANISSSCVSFTGDSFCFNRRLTNSASFFNIIDNTTFLGVSGSIQFMGNISGRLDGNYYTARNVQQFSTSLNYVPVLVWSNARGWTTNAQTTTIIWPGTQLIKPTGYASMRGINLRIAIVESSPFTMKTELKDQSGQTSIKLNGYVLDLIEQLHNRMGFIPNITYFRSDQSYNALIDVVANGTFDIFIGDVTITATRREKVAFSRSIFDNSLRIIVRDGSDSELHLWSYLRPFSNKLWLTLLGATMYAGILICIVERQHNEVLQERSTVSGVAMSMWYSFGTIMGYGADFDVTTAAGRIVTSGLYILSLVLVAAYTANLASDLMLFKSIGAISGINNIKDGKLAFSRVGVLTDTSIEDYYMREVSGGSRNFYPLKSNEDLYSSLESNMTDAAVMDAGTAEYAVNSIYCNLTLVGTDFDKSAFGIVIQKNWLYEQDLDIAILSIKESGTFDTLKVKWLQTNVCSTYAEISTAMTMKSMAGLLMTFAVITLIAILGYIWKKRSIIKNHLSEFIHRKKAFIQQNISPTTNSSEQSLHRKSSSFPILYF